MARILIAEDQPVLRKGIAKVFRDAGHEVGEAEDGKAAVALLRDRPFDVVVTDLKMPKATGMEVLRAAKSRDTDTQVIIMTAFGTVENAVEALKLGACDYIQKPFDIPELELRVKKALLEMVPRAHAAVSLPASGALPVEDEIIGGSPAIREVMRIVGKVASTNSSVLITGETGTGKELIAHAIHRASPRRNREFVKVNCAALPETLLESELFGHEKGAFTGAIKQRIGRFEQADGGTIFLDEIGDMTLFTQAKILRVLQEKQFERLGGNRTFTVDVRILAATNRDLAEEIKARNFREDLYFRLNVIHIHMPPLRERKGDIESLAGHFLDRLRKDHPTPVRGLTDRSKETMRGYAWPGNIREMRNTLERAVLMAEGRLLDVDDLQLPAGGTVSPSPPAPEPPGTSRLKDLEKAAVLETLEKTNFIQSEAAHILGISRRVLHYKIRQFGITHPRWRKNK